MEKEKNNRSIADFDCKKLAYDFWILQQKHKQEQEKFKKQKEMFYDTMQGFFEKKKASKSFTFSFKDSVNSGKLVVNRIQKQDVLFDADKLEKVLSKAARKKVIKKKYEIVNMSALVDYLKQCGVDPVIFKSFLCITKSVDLKELDKMEELGEITIEEVKDCYSVNFQKPYFTVSMKGQNEDSNK